MGIDLGYSNDLFGSATFVDLSVIRLEGECAAPSCSITCHSCKDGCSAGPSGKPDEPIK